MSIVLPGWIKAPNAEAMVIRAMHFVASLEDKEEVSAYDILLRMRAWKNAHPV